MEERGQQSQADYPLRVEMERFQKNEAGVKEFIRMNDHEFQMCLDEERFLKYKDLLSSPDDAVAEETDFDSHTYRNDYSRRGLAIFINNCEFYDVNDQKRLTNKARLGSEYDIKKFISTFDEKLKFDVEVFQNITARQMYILAETAAKSYPHDKADCFVCAICSHGMEFFKVIADVKYGQCHCCFGSDNQPIETGKFWNFFNQESSLLKNKPRIFFIEACRVLPSTCTEKENTEHRLSEDRLKELAGSLFHLPQDFLVMYATSLGYESNSHYENGGDFIQELCKVLQDPADKRLMRLLFQVFKNVAKRREGKSQVIPVVDTRLIKDVKIEEKQM